MSGRGGALLRLFSSRYLFTADEQREGGSPLTPKTIRLLGQLHMRLWKLAGKPLDHAFGKLPFMMLTTTGRKTGQQRTTPVLYLQDGNDLIVVASFGGNGIRIRHGISILSNARKPKSSSKANAGRFWPASFRRRRKTLSGRGWCNYTRSSKPISNERAGRFR